ncbi:MAG: hypothetical protein OEX04_02850 [Acidimicrobiia bacterium]|nr:hypothetical protein [Acidimicrobiia bacterium]MDH4306392.1 hypothetical protein [Acidimicrobiia bacterium]MDH5292134.1 hypothetical protein [Acidimicrobiia bacterium]
MRQRDLVAAPLRYLTSVPLWIGAGLSFWILSLGAGSEPRSPFWFAEAIIYAFYLLVLWRTREGWTGFDLSRRLAPIAYLGLSWLIGMAYELSLTVDGTGIGGVHPETRTSFILAQGDYVPIALVALAATRLKRLTYRDAFFLAAGMSLTEGLVFTGVLTATVLSPAFVLAPLVAAYYALAYSSYVALPLLLTGAHKIWPESGEPGRISVPLLLLAGFVLGFGIRLFWGLVYAPAITALLGLETATEM